MGLSMISKLRLLLVLMVVSNSFVDGATGNTTFTKNSASATNGTASFGSLKVGQVKTVAGASALGSELKVFLVSKDIKGNETLVPTESAPPGAVLEYQATYKNLTKNSLTDLQFDLPIPTGTQFQKEGLYPQKAKASSMIAGTVFADMPLTKVVKDAQNKDKVVLVPLADYKILRWSQTELAAGKSMTVKARVIVINNK
jgi:hypothetical protein